MRENIVFVFLAFLIFQLNAQSRQEFMDFEFQGVELSGVLNFPEEDPKGIVLIIHGDGKTNAVKDSWWYDVRVAILKAGYATYMWDKMGCGNSGGVYQNHRPIQNEALEVITAMNTLKKNGIKGLNKIGLWGISRAGWINPMVIDIYKDVSFWISVSGVDDDESFKYMLEQNLRINGSPEDSIALIAKEWHNSILLSRGGASYKYYLDATQNLQMNQFWSKITNGGISEKGYYDYQKILQSIELDNQTELPLYVDNFDQILSEIDIPVLALFGEKDMTVNWKQTKELYQRTLGKNADLTIQSFPDCNHNMWLCTTGAAFELQSEGKSYIRCTGFLDFITEWLNGL